MQESTDHAALVQLFRDDPTLAATLLARSFGRAVPALPVRVLDPVLRPGALIPDLVLAFADPHAPEHPALIVVVEVQRSVDPDKLFTWPAYLWLERLRWRCEVVLLVVAPDAAVAAWAERPITCGPGNTTQPLVLGPGSIPWIDDPAEARAAPTLTLLSARAHGRERGGLAVVRAALGILDGFDSDEAYVYVELVLGMLSGPALRRFKEELTMHDLSKLNRTPLGRRKYPTPRLDELLGMLFGDRELEVHRQCLRRVLGARRLTPTPEQTETINACADAERIDTWIERAATMTSVAEVLDG